MKIIAQSHEYFDQFSEVHRNDLRVLFIDLHRQKMAAIKIEISRFFSAQKVRE